MPWSKIGDFNAFSGNENYPGQCQFSNEKSSVIDTIYLEKFKTGEQSISVWFRTVEQAERFKEMLSTVDDIGYISSPGKSVKIFKLDPMKLSAHMKHLRELEPKVIELRNQIFQTLGFDPASGVTLEDLKEMPFEKAVKQVLELQENKVYELSYELFNYYWKQAQLPASEQKMEDVPLKKIYEFGNMISKESPFFIKAHEICLDILMQSGVNKSSQEEKTAQSLDDEESEDDLTHINLLKLKFKHALNSDPDLARLLYRELCGLPMDDKRNLKKVQGDYDTLIEIADILRETNQELRVLKQKDKKLSASSAFFPSANVNVNEEKLKASESENNESLKKEKKTNSPHFRRMGT